MAPLLEVRGPPAITKDNRGPEINIIAWICMVTMCMAVLTRLALKYSSTRKVGADDVGIFIAMILAVAQTSLITAQVSNGLARRQKDVSPSQIALYEETGYAANLLYLPILTLSKITILILLHQLTTHKMWKSVVVGGGAVSLVWMVAGVFSLAFQCGYPQPWSVISKPDKCFNEVAFWSVMGFVDILIEILIATLPIFFVRDLKMTRSKKAMVVFAFTFRYLVVLMTIIRIVSISRAQKSSDHTFSAYYPTLYTIVTFNLSLVVTCIPFLRAFMESLQSGLIANHGQQADFRTGDYSLKQMSANAYASKNSGSGNDTIDSIPKPKRVEPQKSIDKRRSVLPAGGEAAEGTEEEEAISVASAGSSRKMIIRKQTVISVTRN